MVVYLDERRDDDQESEGDLTEHCWSWLKDYERLTVSYTLQAHAKNFWHEKCVVQCLRSPNRGADMVGLQQVKTNVYIVQTYQNTESMFKPSPYECFTRMLNTSNKFTQTSLNQDCPTRHVLLRSAIRHGFCGPGPPHRQWEAGGQRRVAPTRFGFTIVLGKASCLILILVWHVRTCKDQGGPYLA